MTSGGQQSERPDLRIVSPPGAAAATANESTASPAPFEPVEFWAVPPTDQPVVVAGSALKRSAKRAFDLVVGTAVGVVLLPVAAAVAAVVAATSRGPVLFLHTRVGKGGELFTCYKFRTMVADADAVLPQLLEADPELSAQFAETQKLTADPRITRVGRVLRMTSLDELPQIINVLRGEMSLVGPRPVLRQELVERYGNQAAQLVTMAPGLTGPWQVSGRNNLSYAERVRLDVHYTVSWSLLGDIRLLLSTISVLCNPRGNGAR